MYTEYTGSGMAASQLHDTYASRGSSGRGAGDDDSSGNHDRIPATQFLRMPDTFFHTGNSKM